jgi:hypothetical protein
VLSALSSMHRAETSQRIPAWVFPCSLMALPLAREFSAAVVKPSYQFQSVAWLCTLEMPSSVMKTGLLSSQLRGWQR